MVGQSQDSCSLDRKRIEADDKVGLRSAMWKQEFEGEIERVSKDDDNSQVVTNEICPIAYAPECMTSIIVYNKSSISYRSTGHQSLLFTVGRARVFETNA